MLEGQAYILTLVWDLYQEAWKKIFCLRKFDLKAYVLPSYSYNLLLRRLDYIIYKFSIRFPMFLVVIILLWKLFNLFSTA